MGTELMIQYSKVGWAKGGRRLQRASGQTKWLVRELTNGRPTLVMDNGVPLLVDFDINPEELKELLGHMTGKYRLHPADENGLEIQDAEIAIFDVKPIRTKNGEQEHMRQMFAQFVSFVESKDVLIADVTKSIIHSNRDLHTSNIEMLNTANTTINVATAIERPEIDLEAMAKYVAKDIKENKEEERQKQAPWHIQLLNGPFGKSLLTNLNTLVESRAKADKNK